MIEYDFSGKNVRTENRDHFRAKRCIYVVGSLKDGLSDPHLLALMLLCNLPLSGSRT